MFMSRALQTPVTLCREQSIRGYVSKESMLVLVVSVSVCVHARARQPLTLLTLQTLTLTCNTYQHVGLDTQLIC